MYDSRMFFLCGQSAVNKMLVVPNMRASRPRSQVKEALLRRVRCVDTNAFQVCLPSGCASSASFESGKNLYATAHGSDFINIDYLNIGDDDGET